MPWIHALLRGQKVLARADASGNLVAEGGRVEIRYKPNDGRAYRAALGNLSIADGATVLPDETCGEGAPPPEKNDKEKTEKPKRVAQPMPKGEHWIVYADGACSGNPGPAGAGVVVVQPGGHMEEGSFWLGEGTNNVAELTAILRSLEAIPKSDERPIVIHTDSQYSIGVLTKGWKAKANQELVAKTKAAVVERGARLVYVPGHAGVPLNERADELAREAIRSRRTRDIVIRAAAPATARP